MKAGAVILGVDNPSGIELLTSFKKNRIPVVAVDTKRYAAGFYSRYRDRCLFAKDADETGIVSLLLKLATQLRNWVLIPNTDYFTSIVSRNHQALSGQFKVASANWDSVRFCIDKGLTPEAAARAGVSVPSTFTPTSRSELEQIANAIDFQASQWIIKPRWKYFNIEGKYGGYSESVFKGRKARPVHSRDSIVRLSLKAYQDTGVFPLIQEKVPGGPAALFGVMTVVDADLNPAAVCVARKMRADYELGDGAYVESTSEPELVEMALRVTRSIGWYGLGEVEFKKDPRDGAFRLIEINPRPCALLALGRACGVDLASVLFHTFVGDNRPHVGTSRTGVGWLYPRKELLLIIRERKLALILGILGQLNRTKAFAYSIRDPLPFVFHLVGLFHDPALTTH